MCIAKNGSNQSIIVDVRYIFILCSKYVVEVLTIC